MTTAVPPFLAAAMCTFGILVVVVLDGIADEILEQLRQLQSRRP